MVVSLFGMILVATKRPFESSDHNALQLFNELLVFLLTATLIGFTNISYNGDDEMAKVITGCFILAVAITVIVNLLLILHTCVFGLIHTCRVRKQSNDRNAWVESINVKRSLTLQFNK